MDAALSAGILMFNVESEEELVALNQRAESLGKKARVALRVNPDVDPKTHPKISTGLKRNKFGIDSAVALDIYLRAKEMPAIVPVGVDCHIGSQLTDLSPFLDAADKLVAMIEKLRSEGIAIEYLDIGGGLGIPYDQEEPPSPEVYGRAVIDRVRHLNVKLILEPGRVLVGNAGVMITNVLYRKKGPEKSFVIVDAAMNDLIRPTLYEAHHSVLRVSKGRDGEPQEKVTADLVGPICESGDFLAQAREIESVEQGELLAIMSAGAYGFTMASNYNSRPRAAEVLVEGGTYHIIRNRETCEDLIRGERIPQELSH
jgi:diaminopimelate decarboxylase